VDIKSNFLFHFSFIGLGNKMSYNQALSLRQDSLAQDTGISRSSLVVYDENFNRISGADQRLATKRKRKRFAPAAEKLYAPPPFVDLAIGLSLADVDQFFREQRLDDLTSKLSRNDWEFGDPDIRPPSPPPTYDRHGARTNSLELRVKTSMQKEYHRLVSFMLKKLPGYVAPLDYKPPKITKRVPIPNERYPDINFSGMILGPRGINHKRMEEESGCQISIRGRGTRGQLESQTEEELNMPMHVCIMGEDEEKISAGIKMIEPLIDPLHPDFESERLRGLEQLALITGTGTAAKDRQLRLVEAGGVDELSYTMIEIKCDVCGGRGHLPSDCPNRKKEASVEEWRINSEYSKLISELSGRPQSENVSGPGSSSHPLAMKTIPTQAPPPPRPVRFNQPKQTQPPPPPPDGGMYIPASGFPPGWKPPP
jgi:splicing factor 1